MTTRKEVRAALGHDFAPWDNDFRPLHAGLRERLLHLAHGDPAWNLHVFVDALKARDVLISNFYSTPTPSFRVGCIGAIMPEDMRRVVATMAEVLDALHIEQRHAA